MLVGKAKLFKTTDADLAAFLMLEGIKFIGAIPTPGNDRLITLQFLDEHENCLDLERVYLHSEFKKFRDLNKYVLKKVHEVKRG